MNRFRTTVALSATASLSAAAFAFGALPSAAATPYSGDQVTLRAIGQGTASTIDVYDPAVLPRMYDVALPFSRTTQTVKSGELYQIVVLGKGDGQVGCEIAVGDTVVASQPVGGSGQCIFTAP